MISLASESMGHEFPVEIESFDNPREALNDFITGKCRMIAIWEPYYSHILQQPGNSVAVEYRDVMGDFPCCCAAVSKRFFELWKRLIGRWIVEYRKMAGLKDFTSIKFRKAIRIVSEGTGIHEALVEKSLMNYDFSSNHIGLEKLKKMSINLSARQKERLFLADTLVD